MTSPKQSRTPLQQIRYAAAVAIFAALSVLGLLDTTTDFAQVCTRTVTTTSTVQSCRPLEPQDPPILFATCTAALLLGSEARYLRDAFGVLRAPAAAKDRRSGGSRKKRNS